jgi:hypothetical protein
MRGGWIAALTAAVLLGIPGAAHADTFGVTGFAVHPSTRQAGAPADVLVHLAFTHPSDDVKRLVVHLPAGLLGNPRATPRCTAVAFASPGGCPADTRVGTVDTTVIALGVLPVDAPGEVDNLAHRGSEPARLGIRLTPLGGLLGVLRLQAPVTVRLADQGLDATLDDLPRSFAGLKTDIASLDMTLAARAGSPPRPFTVLPTRCDAVLAAVEASSYADLGVVRSAAASFSPTGCDAVPFTPGLALTPATQPAGQPGELAVTLTVPGTEEPVRQSHLRAVTVTLPPGVVLSPGVADGLEGCEAAAFAATGACPATARIGDVAFATPLLGELTGDVFLAAPTADHPLRLLVRVDPAGLDVRLRGEVTADPVTGQVTTRFDGLPQVPFTTFTLRFRGGPHAVLRAPETCGTNTGTAHLVPWSGGPPADVAAGFTTGDCPAAGFAPTLALEPGDGTLRTTIERPDGRLRLTALRVLLPPGVAGRLAGIAPCAAAAARSGDCPAAARLGGVRVLIGSGPAPVALTGDAYLAEAPPGALAGLAMVLPGRVGPFDLGRVVVPGRLTVTGDDARVAVDVPALPQLVGGIPLDLRRLELALDRRGFVTHATRCEELSATADVTAVGGQVASVRAPYRAPGCAKRQLATTLTANAGARGATAKDAKPPLSVALAVPDGATNLRRASVTLPTALAVDPAALGTTCSEAQLAASACPAGATLGSARVETPLLDGALEGPVRLVAASAPNALPGLAVDLDGPIHLRLRGSVALAAGGTRLQTTFDAIPDVPLRSFVLRFAGGPQGALRTAVDLCSARGQAALAQLTGQNGQAATVTAPLRVDGCTAASLSDARPRATATLRGIRGRRPDLRVAVTTQGAPLRAVRLTLPGTLRTGPAARVLAGGRRLAGPALTPHSVRLRGLPARGSRAVVLRLRGGALRRAGRVRPGTRVTLRLRVVDSRGRATTLVLRPRAR